MGIIYEPRTVQEVQLDMEERLLQPSKEKHSYGSLDEEEEGDEIDGEDDEKVTVILRRGGGGNKKYVSKSQQEPPRPDSSSSKTIHSNSSKSSSPTKSSITNTKNSIKSNRRSNPDGESTLEPENRSQRSSSHPAMGASSSSQSSVVGDGSSPSSDQTNSKSSKSDGSQCKKDGESKPGPIRRLTSSTSVTWVMRNIRKFMVKYWIWIVALMLMIMSVGGTRVVIYRVFYMFLFLTFILTFQVRLKIHFRSVNYFSAAFVSFVAENTFHLLAHCNWLLVHRSCCSLLISISRVH